MKCTKYLNNYEKNILYSKIGSKYNRKIQNSVAFHLFNFSTIVDTLTNSEQTYFFKASISEE